MMSNPAGIISLTCITLAAAGAVLRVVAAVKLRAHLRRARPSGGADGPALTLWRALKPGVPAPNAKLDALIAGSRPGDQILIGANDAGECAGLRERWPDRDITIVVCEPGRAENPKIGKFIQMAPHARHGRWLLTDSEAMPGPDFVENFRAEWERTGADVLTAGYRFHEPRTLEQLLDSLPAATTLWPGLMLAPRMDFTLGACVALRADDVRGIGGWQALADELAEDHQLGRLLTRAGRRIALSSHVLTLDCDPLTMTDMLRHHHRMAVTYRAAAPLGAIGLPLLHCFPLLVPGFLIGLLPWFAHIPHAGIGPIVVLSGICFVVGAVAIAGTFATMKLLGTPRTMPGMEMVSSVIESACWLCAWFSRRVYWAGKWRRVGWRGRLGRAKH